ncbi:tyrosine-type recombinase/integrase [Roseinatronobacter alkalisoli]|uniref:Tyrosine-type recombinase/integrase n=1 Tax=Roseinatronobacter alkalisoli TaxID=3028235 RepID=A0ABT5TEZ3_9RHOB|nr:tyrosine-type recombinase/integrase [Roseinatronobacter sp. HJB301]MDD7973680.1 tyrosine-type recombinase/integrase [Roseinatronobacter sp. HJB301]
MRDPAMRTSFPRLLQQFFVEYLGQQKAVSRHTVAAYRDTFQLLLRFAQRELGKNPTNLVLEDLSAALILDFLDHLEKERGNSVRSRNARLAAIRAFLKYAAHKDFSAMASIEQVLAVPAKRYDKPVLGFLTKPEIDAIVMAPDTATWVGQRDRAMLLLMYNTGARVSEVAGLKLGDIVLGPTSVAHLSGKGRKRRSIPLWQQTAATLRQWIRRLDDPDSSSALFPSTFGKPMTRSSIARRLAVAVTNAGRVEPKLINRVVSPHIIRHTTAMHLLHSGVDISVIALWLGHESPATTYVYLSADMKMKEEALLRLQPSVIDARRYKAPDDLLAFLKGL